MNKQQLANKIWASANKMRSKIEANEYKDYILGLIFYKFLSDNEVNYLKSIGWTDEDIVTLVENHEDQEAIMMMEYCRNNIGYFIEYKNLFGTWLKPNSEFSVADLSGALNSFDRLISPHYKHVYENIFKTLQAGLSKLGENTASQTRALKNLIKLIKEPMEVRTMTCLDMYMNTLSVTLQPMPGKRPESSIRLTRWLS